MEAKIKYYANRDGTYDANIDVRRQAAMKRKFNQVKSLVFTTRAKGVSSQLPRNYSAYRCQRSKGPKYVSIPQTPDLHEYHRLYSTLSRVIYGQIMIFVNKNKQSRIVVKERDKQIDEMIRTCTFNPPQIRSKNNYLHSGNAAAERFLAAVAKGYVF